MVAGKPNNERDYSVGVAGYGEIGSAIGKIMLSNNIEVVIDDEFKGFLGDLRDCRYIHICTPLDQVRNVINKYGTEPIYIIHSTVPPGFCQNLSDTISGVEIFHAPVRGRHPNLRTAIEEHIMSISSSESNYFSVMFDRCLSHIRTYLNKKAYSVSGWINTELAKVLCTTEVGIDVLWMRHVYELCKKHGANFDFVYTKWRQHYNEGFKECGEPHFTRPILTLMEGPIGGHCVIPNAKHLSKESGWADYVYNAGRINWKK